MNHANVHNTNAAKMVFCSRMEKKKKSVYNTTQLSEVKHICIMAVV